MDILRIFDQDRQIHVAQEDRLLPSALPLRSLGYLQNKTDWVHTTFPTCNFSFIFQGNGRYRWRGGWLEVHAPCVVTQYPGISMEYGPDDTWEELFFIFHPGLFTKLCATGFLDPEVPLWPMKLGAHMIDLVQQLAALISLRTSEPVTDRVDRIVTLMILESRLGFRPARPSPEAERIHQLAQRIRSRPGEPVDWDEVSRELGMHSATFRRHWAKAGYPPPAQFLSELRMKRACRLLAETSESIGQVARQVGFEDPLHFSRRFKQLIGVSPRQYREQDRILRG
jgi:AraC-like DNA-binding protein